MAKAKNKPQEQDQEFEQNVHQAHAEAFGVDEDEAGDEKPEPKEQPHLPPKRVCLRTNACGVWLGDLVKHEGEIVVLANARRIWEWGNQGLDHIAQDGPAKPDQVKLMALQEEVELKAKTLKDPKMHVMYELSERAAQALYKLPAYELPKKAVSA